MEKVFDEEGRERRRGKGEKYLDGSSEDVTVVRCSSGKRWAVVKRVLGLAL